MLLGGLRSKASVHAAARLGACISWSGSGADGVGELAGLCGMASRCRASSRWLGCRLQAAWAAAGPMIGHKTGADALSLKPF